MKPLKNLLLICSCILIGCRMQAQTAKECVPHFSTNEILQKYSSLNISLAGTDAWSEKMQELSAFLEQKSERLYQDIAIASGNVFLPNMPAGKALTKLETTTSEMLGKIEEADDFTRLTKNINATIDQLQQKFEQKVQALMDQYNCKQYPECSPEESVASDCKKRFDCFESLREELKKEDKEYLIKKLAAIQEYFQDMKVHISAIDAIVVKAEHGKAIKADSVRSSLLSSATKSYIAVLNNLFKQQELKHPEKNLSGF